MAEDAATDVNEAEVTAKPTAEATTEPIVESPTTKESSPKEINLAPEELTDDKSESEETDSDDEAEDAVADKTEEPAKRDAESRKNDLSTEIRDLVSKRNVLRDEIASVNAEVYQPQTADDLIAEGEDPAMARVQALEQRTQMAEYNAAVTDLNANLSQQSLQVMHDFPQFDSSSPAYDEALSKRVSTIYQRVAGIQTDPNTGLTIAATVLPYDIYKEFAEIHASGAQNGKVSGQVAAEKMLANSETPSSAAPKRASVDNFRSGLLGLK